MKTRITEMLGIEIPIVQAPMGWIARAQLAAAVSDAGGLGIIETSSGELDNVAREITKMGQRPGRVFGVNIAQMFVRDPAEAVAMVADAGVKFVTTSAGDPSVLTKPLKDAGITVFHVVPSLRGAEKAVAAGVDGLVVEGIEGGGFKNADGASTMVLVPMVAERFDVPLIAAGGIVDGRSMAAAMALGADGVQMGTAMVAAAESPIHDNWKNAIVAATEVDTVVVNRHHRPAMRTLRTERTEQLEADNQPAVLGLDAMMAVYFGGDLEAGLAMSGQVAGRIDSIRPVADILNTTWVDCQQRLVDLGKMAGQ